MTVPAWLTVMANGVLVGHQTTAGASTFVWRERDPMAPYLATATLGKFDLTRYKVDGRIPSYVAVDPAFTNRTVLDKLPSIVDFYSSIYGKYPLDAVGAIVDNAPDVGTTRISGRLRRRTRVRRRICSVRRSTTEAG